MHEPRARAPAGQDTRGIQAAYDQWAASYDADRNATRDLDAAVLRRATLPVAGADVLELGCGTGKNTIWLAGLARSVVAIDLSAGMLERARERVSASHVRFAQQDIRSPWPVAAGTVDAVIGNLVMEHVDDLSPIYSEAARVLRAGGRLWLCELHPERQRRGSQAHFTDARGATIHVPAFQHTVSEYVNAGIAAGLVLGNLGEWLEDGAPAGSPPRLLSVLFRNEVGAG